MNSTKFCTLYTIGTVIGSGAYAEVRKCTCKESGHVRAVKLFKKSTHNSSAQDMVYNEIDVLSSLSHPNIINYD